MKILLALALPVLLIACNGDVSGPNDIPETNRGDAWTWQNPLPHSNPHLGIVTIGEGRAITLTAFDAHETRDGGQTWRRMGIGENESGPYTYHLDMHQGIGVITILGHDRVFVSADNGASWRRGAVLDAGGSATAFRDANHGVVVGADGTVRTTDDGGRTWTPRFSGTAAGLTDVDYLDAQTVVATASDGTILRSTNAGASWTALDHGHDIWPLDVIDITAGIIRIGDTRGGLLTSSDAGQVWSRTEIAGGAIYAIGFTDAVKGVIGGVGGRIHRTTNGGATWTRTAISIDTQVSRIAFGTEDEVWAVGPAGRVYRSTDGGASWSDLYSGPRFNLSDVSFASTAVGMAVGSRDASNRCGLLMTVDGGRTWSRGSVGSPSTNCQAGDLNAVHVIDSDRAVVAGNDGNLWTTADGGASWNQRDSRTTLDLYDIAFANASRGIAVGEFGQLRVTNDGGATWSAPVGGAGTSQQLNAVAFATANVAMLVGSNGVVRRTVDGGSSWAPADDGITGIGLLDVAMLDENTAVAIGQAGGLTAVLRTADGGVSWSNTELPFSIFNRGAIAFTTRTRGYIVQYEGRVHTTSDGGLTWRLEPRIAGSSMLGICTVGGNVAVVVGTGGLILRTTTVGN